MTHHVGIFDSTYPIGRTELPLISADISHLESAATFALTWEWFVHRQSLVTRYPFTNILY